jgi:ATP-dependent DNA helicase RecQ
MKGERPARLVLPRAGAGHQPPRPGERPARPRADVERLPPEAEPVFEALRRLRQELAREQAVPAFVIASDRTLRDLALLRPRTLEQLELAHGIGPAKVERYGRQLLAAVAGANPSS